MGCRLITIDLDELEQIFAELELSHPLSSDTPNIAFLNSQTGAVVRPKCEHELDVCENDSCLYTFPQTKIDSIDRYELILNFVDSIEDGGLRITLDRLLRGRGALRRFKEFLHQPGNEELRQLWQSFESENRQLQIRDWLEGLGLAFEFR